MLNTATMPVERSDLIGRAELALQSISRAWPKPRTNSVRGSSLTQNDRPLSHAPDRTAHLAVSEIQATNVRDGDVLELHRSATVKVDAAEYAFTMMLAELRGVMESPPTKWSPSRIAKATEARTVVDYAAWAA